MKSMILIVAALCHNVNKGYCESIGDFSQVEWDQAPQWQKDSIIAGVRAHIDSGFKLTPQGSHEEWCKKKVEDGWIFGEVKDAVNKTHPCLVPYDQLPAAQRSKDFLFRAIVHHHKGQF